MAYIQPFRALRYDPDRAGSLSALSAPPYDIIDAAGRAELAGRSPYNVIRIILGEDTEGSRGEDAYREAAACLSAWQREGILIREQEPCIYLCEQAFALNGSRYVRRGFLSAVLLEEFGKGSIFPHERTLSAPRADRLNLMRACRAVLSPVLAFYSDRDGTVDRFLAGLRRLRPLYDFSDGDGIHYRVSGLADPEQIEQLRSLMHGRRTVIADGHHRYESALIYKREARPFLAPEGTVPEDFSLLLCVSSADSGLKILPTHRLVRVPGGLVPERFLALVSERFHVEPIARRLLAAPDGLLENGSGSHRLLGCYLGRAGAFLLRPRASDAPPTAADEAWHELPVMLLHELILHHYLRFEPSSSEAEGNIRYLRDAEKVVAAVDTGAFDVGFLLPHLVPDTVHATALAGHRLPPKATYFYPKIASGLVFYPFD